MSFHWAITHILDDFQGPNIGHFRLDQLPNGRLLTANPFRETIRMPDDIWPVLFKAI